MATYKEFTAAERIGDWPATGDDCPLCEALICNGTYQHDRR